jgi:hypothetical protein
VGEGAAQQHTSCLQRMHAMQAWVKCLTIDAASQKQNSRGTRHAVVYITSQLMSLPAPVLAAQARAPQHSAPQHRQHQGNTSRTPYTYAHCVRQTSKPFALTRCALNQWYSVQATREACTSNREIRLSSANKTHTQSLNASPSRLLSCVCRAGITPSPKNSTYSYSWTGAVWAHSLPTSTSSLPPTSLLNSVR